MFIPALKKTYANQVVLDLPELEIPDGSILAVRGYNGSGKSTFAKILAGIVSADGNVKTVSDKTVGYMSQQSLAFNLSIKNNLLQNADKSKNKAENEAKAIQLIKEVGLEHEIGKNARRLSGGQKQRMSLARILMKPYDLLILDEPTASMDPETVPLAEELILRYRKEHGCTVILISHSKDQVKRMADAYLYLEAGKIKDRFNI